MNKAAQILTPLTQYVLSASLNFSRFDQQVLIDYYQPLMSPKSVGLFLTLKRQLKKRPNINMAEPISKLLRQLNCGMLDLRDSFAQLEAVGLIKCFENSKTYPGLLIFELQETMAPSEFVKDSLLSVQLLEMVGPDRFKELGQEAVAYQIGLDGFENVSQGFFDVYSPAESETASSDPLIHQARERVAKYQRHRVDNRGLSSSDFDFHFLAQQLAGQGLDSDTIQANRQLIISEHLTYGFDEIEMAKLMTRSIDLVSNEFDAEKFKLLAREAGADHNKVQKNPKPVSSVDVGGATNKSSDFSAEEQLLVKQSEQLTPINFLKELKKQIHAYVSPNEQRVVERLVNQSGLDTGAINILLWYIIACKEKANINSSLADAIANSWSASGVHNATDALKAAQKFQNQNAQPKPRRYSNYRYKQSTKDEKLPQWAQKGYHQKHEQASDEDAAAIAKLLAKSHQSGKSTKDGGKQ